MAKNAPYGDNRRVGMVKERSQTYTLRQSNGLSAMLIQGNLWM